MSFADKTLTEFSELLASNAPVPGGGGAAALVGALGCALCSMAGNLTVGKKKYAEFEDDIKIMLAKAELLRCRFLELVDEDANAFEPLSKAYSMPKDAPDYDRIMRCATLNACRAPIEMMKCCREAIDMLSEMKSKCSKLMISDVGCGAALAKAALEAAAMNVFVNTRLMAGDAEAEALEKEANDILGNYIPLADIIVKSVITELKGR